jgi:hypothetical protein
MAREHKGPDQAPTVDRGGSEFPPEPLTER